MAIAAAVLLISLTGCGSDPVPSSSAVGPAASAAPDEPVALQTADADAWLDGLLPALLEREGIAGAVVSIVHAGDVVTERGYGWADLGGHGRDPVPVDAATTLFRIGSVSKTITATAVMQLVEAGKLDLDRPAQDYLDIPLPDRFEQPITLRHLLTHTAGFEDQLAGVIGDPTAPVPSLRDIVSIDPPEQIFEPGTMPAYSNYSNALAGYIVERVSGLAYADYVEQHIFSPAGMVTATMEQPLPAGVREHMSRGYDAVGADEVPFEMVGPAPAGAVSATAPDMSAYLLAQLGHARSGQQLLSLESFDALHRPALEADTLGDLARGPRMAIGFFQQDRNGHRILEHGGDLTAFHAQLQIYPDDDTAVFVALNSTGIRSDASTIIRDLVMNGFADRYFPDRRDRAEPLASSAEHAAMLEGSYLVSRRSESTFLRMFSLLSGIDIAAGKNGTVTVSAVVDAAGTPREFVEVEPWVWQEVDGQRRIAVDQADGVIRSVGLNAAFALVPMPPIALPILPIALFATAVLLAGLCVRPVAAGVRWLHRVRIERTPVERRLRLVLLLSELAFIGAGIFWIIAARGFLNDVAPADLVIRSAQAFTALSLLGLVPAVWLFAIRTRTRATESEPRRWPGTVGVAVTALAYVGLCYVVIVGGMLLPSITY